MDLSIYLGQVASVYLIIVGLGLFINKGEMLKAAHEFVGANASFVFYGAVALIFGLLVVFSHNIWDGTWRSIITLMGWLATVKGTMAILFPKVLKGTTSAFVNSKMTNVFGVLVIGIGVYLFLQVF